MYGRKKLGEAPKFSIFSLSGNANHGILDIDPRELSNVDAGIWTLALLAEKHPGITWRQLASMNSKMSGIGDWFKRGVRWTKDAVGDTANFISDKSGSAIRLLTDEQVQAGLSRYGQAYATGGTSEGVRGLLDNFGGGGSDVQNQVMSFLSNLGGGTKRQINTAEAGGFGGIDPKLLMMGAGGLILLVLLTGRR